jgi:hypothetical protein
MYSNRLKASAYNIREHQKTEEKEKKWDNRFVLEKIPPYDAFKDANYLSLGLMKSKIKYERFLEKEKQKKLRGKTPRLTQHYIIDSHKSKEKNKKGLFCTYTKNNMNENMKNKNALTQTYSYKLTRNKNSSNKMEENKLSVEEIDLLDEFDIIKNMWNKLGVTKAYQENFINFLNSLEGIDNIRMYLNVEKKQMQKFKYELTQVLKKIIKRNDEIVNLKQLIGLYENILKEKKNNPEKNNENLDSLCNINEKQIISDIHSCLTSLRIITINVVNQIKSFIMSNSYYLYTNKINFDKIKKDYYYNDDYLLMMKSDLDFIQHSVLNTLYEFEAFEGGDPFFLSFTKLKEKEEQGSEKQNNKKIKLEINKKILDEVQNCIIFMQEAEILYKTKNAIKINTNKNKVLEFITCGNNKEENCKKKSYGIGNLFKGNLEQDIIKLKMTKGYDRIFNFIKTNSTNENLYKERIPKKSGKNRNKIQVMTSRELKKKLTEYELLNELINDTPKENNKDEEFKKRDEEININNIQKNEEKKEELEHDKYNKEFEDIKDIKDENHEKKENEEKKEDEEKNESKEEENIAKKDVEENIVKEEENEKEENNEKENDEENQEEKEVGKKELVDEEKNIEKEKQEHKDSKIGEEIEEMIDHDKNKIENKEEEKPTYSASFFTESLDKLSLLYNEYLSKNPNIYTPYTPNKSRDFLTGIYPKIIIAKKDNENEDKIYGICGINFYIDENKEYVLKINHISVFENNKDLLNKMIESIENDIKAKIKEIELVEDKNNNIDDKNILREILECKEYKEIPNNGGIIYLRKKCENDEYDNINEIGSHINYDSMNVLSMIINKDNKEILDNKYKWFDQVINPINLSLLIDKLKINDKYTIEIPSSNSKTSLIEKLSKLEGSVFDFIKTQNNDCSNINEITNNEINLKRGFYYSILNNALNIQMNTLMTLKIDNYLFNGIQINIKNNLIKDPKYNNNLYLLPTINHNVFILLYQYNDEFETNLSKENIYDQFISLFNTVIKNYISEAHNDDDNNNKKILWIPSFNINTNLFSSVSEINKCINIKNNEDVDMKIDEYNEFLKISYLPDNNNDKNIEMNINNSDNDIIIKDKFIFGICHKEFLEICDIPIISLVNVTKDNFIKDK